MLCMLLFVLGAVYLCVQEVLCVPVLWLSDALCVEMFDVVCVLVCLQTCWHYVLVGV